MKTYDHLCGAQVSMEYQGRTLLGDVLYPRTDEATGMTVLRVRHFNGEPWPCEPEPWAVTVLRDRNQACDNCGTHKGERGADPREINGCCSSKCLADLMCIYDTRGEA